MPFHSPLRYPGGKRKLASFVQSLIEENGLERGVYVEPYAGGAAVALHLLFESKLRRIVINDLDPSIHAFWVAIKDHCEDLCRRVSRVRVNMAEWRRQKAVQVAKDPEPLDLAFSTLFLNRTNRSGVLLAGVIGGKSQRGKWRMTVRFNKDTLIDRIEAIGAESDRLDVRGVDAAELLTELNRRMKRAFIFLDPPYYHKADRRLYRDDYSPSDHKAIAHLLNRTKLPWLLCYDDCPEVRQLYSARKATPFTLSYTAGHKRRGLEVLFASPCVTMPSIDDRYHSWWAS